MLADGHAVGVVLDGRRDAEAVLQPVPYGEAVPAGHPGRQGDHAGVDVHRSRQGEADAAQQAPAVPVGEAFEGVGQSGQCRLGPVGRRERHGGDVGEAAAGVDDAHVGVHTAEFGRHGVSVAAAEPQHLARTSAGRGQRAHLGDQAVGHQLAHREGDRRRCGAEQRGEFGARGRLPGGEEFKDALGQ